MVETLGHSLCISAIFIFPVLALISHALVQGKRRDRVWQQLATRYGGSCTAGGLVGFPSVKFTYADTSVLVDNGGQNKNLFTQQALLTRAAGIAFVEQEAAFSLDEAICRICGEPVTHAAAICRRCKTPHHRECWRYYGACSIYGCGETKYLVNKKKSSRDAKRAS